jgi:hypothetical protein
MSRKDILSQAIDLLNETMDPIATSQKLKRLIEAQATLMRTEDFHYKHSIKEKENKIEKLKEQHDEYERELEIVTAQMNDLRK